MIRYLKGTVIEKSLKGAVLDTGGVGYAVAMPLTDLASFAEIGEVAEVHVATHLRDGAIDLFAFRERITLQMFERLIAVNGVGPKGAIGILSGIDVDELIEAVTAGDEKRLQRAPGVGKKTAARIVLELKDKFVKEGLAGQSKAVVRPGSPLDDLESALSNLGYRGAQIDRALKAVRPLVEEGAALDVLVRESLRHV